MSVPDEPVAGQFGAGTVIPSDVRLIILDCFETLVEMQSRCYVPRRGMPTFLGHFADRQAVPVVVVSDGEQAAVEAAVVQAGLRDRLAAIWGAPDALAPAPDGRMIKRLDLALTKFTVERAAAVFIGDSPLDAEAARLHAVPFIRVPRSEDQAFSFERLIGGPSRYNSSEFSSVMFEKYLKRKRP